MNTDFGNRLKKAREHAGLNQKQLAARVGISQPTLSNLERTGFKSGFTPLIAAVCGVNPMWLATGECDMLDKNTGTASNVEAAPALSKTRRVPVVGQVKGGIDGYLEEAQYPAGFGEGYVEYWGVDSLAYALRVKGDSMHPRYRAGEFIVVSPGHEAMPGDDVVVTLADGRKLLKQLNWQRDGEIQLLSINHGYDPTTLSASEVLTVHLVAGRVPSRAFKHE